MNTDVTPPHDAAESTPAADRAPAKCPGGSCPYRRDVPSGVWAVEEYAKLAAYDAPTGEPPPRVFACHAQTVSGWARQTPGLVLGLAVHDG